MRGPVSFFFLVSFLVVFCVPLNAQQVGRENIGFESGDFDGWVGYQWRYSTASDVPSSFNTTPAAAVIPTSRRHVIISDKSAYDANTGGALKMIPDGYNYSARLGCEISRDASPRCWQQSLRYTMKVDESNAFLLMKFACVLQYSTSHDNISEMEPHFQLTLYDRDDNTIDDCSNYDVFSSGNMDAEFQTYAPTEAHTPVKWRDWTTVGADLSAYIGQDITIEFLTADCTGHYHYGYAYFVVDYMPLYITVDYCTDDSHATLEAPDGFQTYQWLHDDKTTIVGEAQDLLVENPNEGDLYYCTMESETGCEVSLSSTIARYEPQAGFSWNKIDCESNEVEFINESSTNNGSLKYSWDLEDTILTQESLIHKFATSGLHKVGLIIYNPPSGCTDTIYKTVESFSPALVGFHGDTTYCPDLETELTAYGAYSYEWSTGALSPSLSFRAPENKYWLLGFSSDGCISDTSFFSISEEPDWHFELAGDSNLCTGDTDTLSAFGAVDYDWSTGSSNANINISSGGTYNVTGKNARGCEKELSIDVLEVKNPEFDFSVSPATINKRYNVVDCVASSDSNLIYNWNMGDGTTSIGSQFTHSYTLSSELKAFPVNIMASNDAGCFTKKATEVIVEPFVPNVFTPNNDGINDLFMPGYDIEVFDRHGVIFYTGREGWDGYYQGKPADPDTYFYVLRYIDFDENSQVRKGYITLVR
ncbi:PKD domain-containing protein [Maribellus mangrovi]|uniref:PKD domain-containing protein n=1 Tax=Maribellus mangrovi TaxID=3133146 RepID=UPI0030EB1F49